MEALFFYLFGGLAVITALVTITRRDAVTSAFWLIACFLNVAALFAMLSAQFIAVMQILIYAGAIMVFFLFVTMFLGEPRRVRLNRGRAIPLISTVTVLLLAYLLMRITNTQHRGFPSISDSYGSVAMVSRKLLVDYVFLFEVTGLLLLVAVIGAVYVARKPRTGVGEGEGHV